MSILTDLRALRPHLSVRAKSTDHVPSHRIGRRRQFKPLKLVTLMKLVALTVLLVLAYFTPSTAQQIVASQAAHVQPTVPHVLTYSTNHIHPLGNCPGGGGPCP